MPGRAKTSLGSFGRRRRAWSVRGSCGAARHVSKLERYLPLILGYVHDSNAVFTDLPRFGGSVRATEADPRDQLLPLDLEGRFGSADGALSLRAIGSMTLTHGIGDSLLITQFQVPAILVLSASGDSLGMIGRGGSGPGEFSVPLAVSILRDTIWIPDLRGPILRFGADGEYIDQLRVPVPPLGSFQYAPTFRAALTNGDLLFQANSNPVGREAKAAVQALAWIRVSRNAAVIDTLAMLPVRETSYVLEFADGRAIVGSHPAANSDMAAVDPEGRWIVVASQELEESVRFGFTLRWISIDGDTAAEHYVQTTPISVESVRAEWIDRLATGEELPRGAVEAAANDVPFPAQQAAALRVFADSEGRAWIKSPHVSADSMTWYAVGQDRGLLGSVVLPQGVELMAANAESVWGWAPGAYDEPQILKFRLR